MAENFYKRIVWKNKRRAILSRDQYRCASCRQYGRFTEAITVHHIFPLEYFPEYRLSNWNLVSLCSGCHNELHDRDSHRLTAKGWKLLEKTARAQGIDLPPKISGKIKNF